jgi:hypothetical protein
MHNIKACRQMVPHTAFPQCCRVFGITIKSYNAAQLTHEPCGPKSDSSYVRANVIGNSTRLNPSTNCILNIDFMFPAPVALFVGKTKLHPHSLR